MEGTMMEMLLTTKRPPHSKSTCPHPSKNAPSPNCTIRSTQLRKKVLPNSNPSRPPTHCLPSKFIRKTNQVNCWEYRHLMIYCRFVRIWNCGGREGRRRLRRWSLRLLRRRGWMILLWNQLKKKLWRNQLRKKLRSRMLQRLQIKKMGPRQKSLSHGKMLWTKKTTRGEKKKKGRQRLLMKRKMKRERTQQKLKPKKAQLRKRAQQKLNQRSPNLILQKVKAKQHSFSSPYTLLPSNWNTPPPLTISATPSTNNSMRLANAKWLLLNHYVKTLALSIVPRQQRRQVAAALLAVANVQRSNLAS
mmetsp:Transcript_31868/g.66987  ORF Transcript_31868/g.66987 Transcript_31868/m.66987 type:complete len:303 (-) Transcript_31868:361-1269(-)